MNRTRSSLATELTLAAVAALTTWVSLLSWRGFTADPAGYLGPLLVLAVVVAGIGALARWWRTPRPWVVLMQLAGSAMVACTMLCGAPVPLGGARARLVATFQDAVHSANQFAPPVPVDAPSVHPLLIAGGLGCLLLVDVLACTVRRVPLAGLPLLAVYSVPVSMIGGGLSWWVFALTSAAFLALLYLHESDRVARWGRSLGGVEDDLDDGTDPQGFGVRTGAVRASAGAIGGVVTALAVAVPLAVPTLSVHVFDFGAGNGGGSKIELSNPMVSLQRDLRRGQDVPLLTVRTSDPDPTYLRIAVLNQFQDDRWSAGDRDVPTTQRADGRTPALVGVPDSLARTAYGYQVTADPDFESSWLPTTQNVSRIVAAGDWRYDVADMDFLAGDHDLTTARLTWSFTGVKLNLSADSMAAAGTSVGQVGKQFTTVPTNLDPLVRNLALAVTRDQDTAFGKAVALQQWFRQDGGFVYDDSVKLGDGADDLAAFLEQDGDDGRRGYCQQFAASMAVMARTLGIPARVAVGFLAPEKVNQDTYVYSAHDMHAWPELYFAGAGWVRFEPTPAGRAAAVPGYTTQSISVPDPTLPSVSGNASQDVPSRGSQPSDTPDKTQDSAAPGAGSGSGLPWRRVAGGGALVLLLAGAATGPRLVRRRRRDRRQRAGPEEAWAELRDSAVDLGVPWPRERSPRQTRDALVRHFGAAPDELTVERPVRGPDTNPAAVQALDRVVDALERLRYARTDGPSSNMWHAEVTACVDALTGGAPRAARRVATWWPRSVFARTSPIHVRPASSTSEPTYTGVTDRVG